VWRLPRRFAGKSSVRTDIEAHWEPLDFELPQADKDEASPWRRWIDTARETPDDIVPWEEAPEFPELIYRAEARSVVVLFAHGRS
jgi:isoamylase